MNKFTDRGVNSIVAKYKVFPDPAEMESELVSYLALSRLGLEKKSADYLAGFIHHASDLQNISPGSNIKVAAQIEGMGKRKISQKKHKKNMKGEEQPKLFG